MTEGGVREHEIRVDGIRSPVIEAGPEGAKEAVVFVHGNPGSRLDWDDLVLRVGGFSRAVAFDMPGFGQADKPKDAPYTVPFYARFIADTLEALGVERVHLAMHDFGGPFGLTWAADHQERLASLILFNAPTVADYRWYLLAKVWRTPVAGELLHLTLTRPFFDFNVKRGNGRPLPATFVDRMWRDYDAGTRRAVLKLYRASPARRLVAAPPSFFRGLRVPALIVWGRRDAYIPERFAEHQRATFPGAEMVYLDRSGHWPFIDDPERSAAAVLPFLRAQSEGATA